MLPPTHPPFDPKWTAALLRRDVKVLKSKCIRKIKTSISGKVAKTSSPPHKQTIPSPIVEPEGSRHTVDNRVEQSATPSEVLEGKLKTLYASRDRNMPHAERWRYRGGWLVVYMAVQACPSSSSYDILRVAEKLGQMPTSQKARRRLQKPASRMPAAPYSKPSESHKRVDSGVSGILPGEPQPTSAQMWHEVYEAASDHDKIVTVAEELLGLAWSEASAAEIIELVGHPGKRFESEDELRVRFRSLLFPEYDDLANAAPR